MKYKLHRIGKNPGKDFESCAEIFILSTSFHSFFCGASECFMKAFKGFIKPFEAPQRSLKIKIYLIFFSSSGIETYDLSFKKFPY